MAKPHQRLRCTATQFDEGEWKVKTDDLYNSILKIYYKLYTIKLKICTQRFYYYSFKISKFIQGKSPLLQ